MPEHVAARESSAFEYVQAVCDAIERYTAARVAEDASAFVYRGANLRYAAERALYVHYANDDALYARFQASPDWALEIPEGSNRPPSLARRLKNWFDPPRAPVAAAAGPPVLVHVIHEKFVRYLQPVMDRVPAYAYLAALNDQFATTLARLDVPQVDMTADVLPAARVPPTLVNFGELPAWYDRLHHSLSVLRPRCVVLVEGNAAQDEVMHRACVQLGIPTVCIQQGWSPFVHNGFRNMTYTQMAVWGEGFADLLRPFNPSQQFVATGHLGMPPRADAAADGVRPRRAVGFFLQAPGRLISGPQWLQFLTLIDATAEQHPGIRVVVREHPARPLNESEKRLLSRPNIEMAPPEAYALGPLLKQLDVVASIYSTVLQESVAAGVVPVVVNLTSIPSYSPDIAAAGAGVEVHSVGDAGAAIARLLTNRDYHVSFTAGMNEFRRRFFAPEPSPADRIAALISATAGR